MMNIDGEKLLAEFERQLKVLHSYEKTDIECNIYNDIALRRNFMQGIERAISTIKSGDYATKDGQS